MPRSVLPFRLPALLITNLLLAVLVSSGHGYTPMPVAVRWWGGDTVSIETYWQPPVVIDPTTDFDDKLVGAPLPGLILQTRSPLQSEMPEQFRGGVPHYYLRDELDKPTRLHDLFYREPNQRRQRWEGVVPGSEKSADRYAMLIGRATQIPPKPDEPPAEAPLVIYTESGGPRIVHFMGVDPLAGDWLQKPSVQGAEVVLLPLSKQILQAGDELAKALARAGVGFVVPLGKTSKGDGIEDLKAFTELCEQHLKVREQHGNTLAVSFNQDGRQTTTLVLFGDEPLPMSEELAGLMGKMEDACRASQEVFAGLTVEQMNFRPAGGTHTPRWNAEHMMGRQLQFFTQIFAAMDPAFKLVDLNPKQMPTDYEPAHHDWTGAEEARQMERVSQFVRRFAYLLEGVGLDARAPGSRWTLRRLLKQMDRHFAEHTANVKKKFEMKGWPGE